MHHSYRIWRNCNTNTKDATPVSIELIKYPSRWQRFVGELTEAAEECCALMHDVPLPKWLGNWKRKWGCDCKPGEKCECLCAFRDYFGDDLGGLWHVNVECALDDYMYKRAWNHTHTRWVNVPLSEMGDDPDVQWIRDQIATEAQGGEYHDWNWHRYPAQSRLFRFLEFMTRPWRRPPKPPVDDSLPLECCGKPPAECKCLEDDK